MVVPGFKKATISKKALDFAEQDAAQVGVSKTTNECCIASRLWRLNPKSFVLNGVVYKGNSWFVRKDSVLRVHQHKPLRSTYVVT